MGYMGNKFEDLAKSKKAKKMARDMVEALAESRFKPGAGEITKKIYRHQMAIAVASGAITGDELREIEKKYKGNSVIVEDNDWVEEVPEDVLSIITPALECYVENTVLIENKERAKEILKAIEG